MSAAIPYPRLLTALALALSSVTSEQVHMCGNSVSPPVAAALVRANIAEEQSDEVAA